MLNDFFIYQLRTEEYESSIGHNDDYWGKVYMELMTLFPSYPWTKKYNKGT